MYKGDICRTFVLAREGGFCVDLDVEPLVPFRQLIDEGTTFMSSYTHGSHARILNAFMAAAPNSAILLEALEEMRRHYRGEAKPVEINQMGPETLARGLQNVVGRQCGILWNVPCVLSQVLFSFITRLSFRP